MDRHGTFPGRVPGVSTVGHREPRRDRLRRASAASHEDFEARLAAAGCFDSLDGYARYLAAVAPLYVALEGTLDVAGIGRLLPDWARRRKAELFAADLRALSAAGANVPAPCPAPEDGLPPRWHAGAALAALYVLEGTTRGGTVPARRVRRFGLTRERGAASLAPCGPARGAMWRGFLGVFEGAALTPEEADLGSRAVAVFALFAARVPAPVTATPLRPHPVRA